MRSLHVPVQLQSNKCLQLPGDASLLYPRRCPQKQSSRESLNNPMSGEWFCNVPIYVFILPSSVQRTYRPHPPCGPKWHMELLSECLGMSAFCYF